MNSTIKHITLQLLLVSNLSVFATNDLNKSTFPAKKVKKQKMPLSLLSNYDEGGVKGQLIATAGVGFNFANYNFRKRYDDGGFSSASTYDKIAVKSSPFINLVVDYGLLKNFSMGVAFGYQRSVVEWSKNGYYTNYNYTPDTIRGSDTWTRIHLAVRGDFRILAKRDFGVYAGARVGYNSYTMKSTYTDTVSYLSSGFKLEQLPFSAQAHLGFSYWVKGIVGVNAEMGIGLGGPYVFAVGITGKFK